MPFPFEVILIFSYISFFLFLGTLLRGNLAFFQRYFIPSSLIGGFIGLLVLFFLKNYFKSLDSIDYKNFESFAYHLFNLSFISIGLTPSKESQEFKEGALWMAFIQGVSFPMQAFLGGILTLMFFYFGFDLHPTFGLLLPLGFNEGPGQALSMGKVWETFGFANAATVGLSFATFGYLICFLFGVPLANWGIQKGLIKNIKISEESRKGFYKKNSYETTETITFHNSNIEPLAFQFSLLGIVYLITFGIIKLLGLLVPLDIQKMMWGFFFLFGLVFGIIIKKMFQIVDKEYLIQPHLQRRITSFLVDYLIVSTIIAIQPIVVVQFFIPILVISLFGGFVSLFIVYFFGMRLHQHSIERMVAIFGTITGTASTGLILLRMVDPELKSPAMKELGFMNLFSVPIVGGFLVFINAYYWWNISIIKISILYFFLGSIFILLLVWKFKNK